METHYGYEDYDRYYGINDKEWLLLEQLDIKQTLEREDNDKFQGRQNNFMDSMIQDNIVYKLDMKLSDRTWVWVLKWRRRHWKPGEKVMKIMIDTMELMTMNDYY